MYRRSRCSRPAILLAVLVAATISIFTLRSAAQVQVTARNNLQVDTPALRQAEPPLASATAAELEKQGDELRSKKAFLDALDYYRAALNKSAAKATLYNKIGILQMHLQHWGDASRNFERSIKADHSHPEAINNLAVMQYENKNYGSAIKNYRKAIALDPESASFYNNLGAAYFEQQDFKKAAEAYRKALELDPDLLDHKSADGISFHLPSPGDRAHYFYVIAKMYANIGQFDRALLCLRRSMEDGYKDINQVYKDQEFANLRKTEQFTALMTVRPVAVQQ